jgi:hypothetical protein
MGRTTNVTRQVYLISSYFTTFPAGGRRVGVLIENKTNSAQLELELGLSLAITTISQRKFCNKLKKKKTYNKFAKVGISGSFYKL